jgi:hypothetical protein
MKIILSTIVLFFASGNFFFAFPQEMKGKVYFFQCPASNASGIGPGNSVFMDGKVICNLEDKRYSIHEIEPGEHSFSFQKSGDVLKKEAEENSILINVESGKIYYVELFTISLNWKAEYFISEVPEGTFTRVTKKYKQNKNCK